MARHIYDSLLNPTYYNKLGHYISLYQPNILNYSLRNIIEETHLQLLKNEIHSVSVAFLKLTFTNFNHLAKVLQRMKNYELMGISCCVLLSEKG